MLKGRTACMSAGRATADPVDGLYNDSDLSKPENTKRFADSHGLTLLHAKSWEPGALAKMMEIHGPLMMNMLWNAPSFIAGKGSTGDE